MSHKNNNPYVYLHHEDGKFYFKPIYYLDENEKLTPITMLDKVFIVNENGDIILKHQEQNDWLLFVMKCLFFLIIVLLIILFFTIFKN